MKCPACSAELKQRERSGYKCSKCKQPFALDPKLNPLRLSDLRLRALDRKLSDEGRLRYTVAQLLHTAAVPTVAAQQPYTGMPIGCGVIIAIGALFFAASAADSLLLGFVIAGVVLLAIFFERRYARRQPFYRKLPIDRATFVREILGRWQKVYGALPPGLLSPEHMPAEPAISSQRLRGALVCADADLRAFLAANGIAERYGLALLPAGPPFTPGQQAHLDMLQTLPTAPFLVLHDASANGCFLVVQLRELFGIAAEPPIIDLGLHPQDVAPQQLILGAPPDPVRIAQLRAQGSLAEADLNWLAAGNVAPLVGVAPKRLIALIERGMQRAARPDAEVQQVGFMSWPTR